jgi:hypothetical protein
MTNLPEAVNRVVRVFGVTPLYVAFAMPPPVLCLSLLFLLWKEPTVLG